MPISPLPPQKYTVTNTLLVGEVGFEPTNHLNFHLSTNELPLLLHKRLAYEIQPVRYLSSVEYSAMFHVTRLCAFLISTTYAPSITVLD